MITIKRGSKGDDVVTLQKALGITADGDFGPMTESAVKSYQSAHGLTADGIVGAKTWAALGVKDTSKCVDPSVVYLPLSVHVSKLPGRSIKYLAIHFTAGSSSAPGRARSIKHVFEQRKASADFAVDDAAIKSKMVSVVPMLTTATLSPSRFVPRCKKARALGNRTMRAGVIPRRH